MKNSDATRFQVEFEQTARLHVAVNASKGDNKSVKTLRLAVDPHHLGTVEADRTLRQAAAILCGGGLVALPTETVYGLGANALDPAAVARIFAAKQRPAWDPMIVHISDLAMLDRLASEIPESAKRLMEVFWPGPLTLLLPRTAAVPDAITAGRPLVGLRMPAHPVALELIRRAGVPIAAPSANTFGHTSPTSAEHVLEDLDGRIDAVLDGGHAERGVESTVIDPCQTPMVIYRPGAITAEMIRAVAGPVQLFSPSGPLADLPKEAMPSPGVGLRHYAPRARLLLVDAPLVDLQARLEAEVLLWPGKRVGLMLPAEVPWSIPGPIVHSWGRWAVPEEMARELYAGLRALDAQQCNLILCPLPPAEGIGAAIRDRLFKAGNKGEAGNRDQGSEKAAG